MNVKRATRNLIIILLVISSICCDQVSKSIVRKNVGYNTQINLLSDYVILTKVENTGAFLGLGDSIPRPWYIILMIILPILVIAYIIYYIFKKDSYSVLTVAGISLLIGGGLGNIVDRILYGSVTDFLRFDFIIFHTGILNLADVSVTTGLFIILFDNIINRKKHQVNEVK